VDYVLRFLAGGIVVSLFAILGDVLRPKSVAGLFGAAPSVALATLSLAFYKEGPDYVATEGRTMILGAIALGVYSLCAAAAWFVTAFGLQQLLGGL
jgi:hypothetical protein